jgi:UDP-2,3-diacylglucosamine pyrophosphatase LpxH
VERTWIPQKNIKDFTFARYTAVISDLHLCEAEPVNRKHPLWKKYKTRQFFFDTTFRDFLSQIEEMAKGEAIELIFNGDTFDFDSVTKVPENPPFQISRIERSRGMFTQSDKSVFKMRTILGDHPIFVNALRDFIGRGHRVVFIIGNHDLELIWPDVQRVLLKIICPRPELADNIRFCEFFYISNQDTLVEHGHQYDPYCRAEDPIHPFVLRYNRLEIKIPFGNLACRYMINAMGFFNPYTESNYIMTVKEYARFFFRYIARAQPLLILTWMRGATLTLLHTIRDRLRVPLKDPLVVEERIEEIAARANTKPRVVRELKELAVPSAASQPFQIAQELWLDRALIDLSSCVSRAWS